MRSISIDSLRQQFRGALIRRGDPDYERARELYNAMIDKRPLIIARCASVADVIAAVRFAGDDGLPPRHTRRRPQRPWPRQLR